MKEDEIELQNMRGEHEVEDAREPLIDGESGLQEQEREQDPSQYGPARGSLRSAGRVVWMLTLSAGISGLLFGCMYLAYNLF